MGAAKMTGIWSEQSRSSVLAPDPAKLSETTLTIILVNIKIHRN